MELQVSLSTIIIIFLNLQNNLYRTHFLVGTDGTRW